MWGVEGVRKRQLRKVASVLLAEFSCQILIWESRRREPDLSSPPEETAVGTVCKACSDSQYLEPAGLEEN